MGGALVTLVAAVHYFYMREFWVQIGKSPIVYRYIDWSITVPLQMVEFYLILSAVQPSLGAGMFWRLLVGTVVMLAAGYCGEAGFMNPMAGFIVGMAGWGFILYEIFSGEAGSVAATGDKVSEHVKTSFGTMRFIATVGWSIYPLGYFFGYLMGGVDDDSLNLVYNLADFINKIAFCLAIWASAKKDTSEKVGNQAPRTTGGSFFFPQCQSDGHVSRAAFRGSSGLQFGLAAPHRYGEVFCRHRRHFSGSPSWVQVRQRLDLLECGAGADFGLRRHQFAKKQQRHGRVTKKKKKKKKKKKS